MYNSHWFLKELISYNFTIPHKQTINLRLSRAGAYNSYLTVSQSLLLFKFSNFDYSIHPIHPRHIIISENKVEGPFLLIILQETSQELYSILATVISVIPSLVINDFMTKLTDKRFILALFSKTAKVRDCDYEIQKLYNGYILKYNL